MGKIGGFLQHGRKDHGSRVPEERIGDFNEFAIRLPEEEQKIQASRCMNCGTPFCQTGMLIDGRVTGCPLHNLIPEWNDLIFKGKWDEAYDRLALTNPFPEFTGRVCPAPCEAGCNLGLNEDPTSIKDDELQIIERAFEAGLVKPMRNLSRSGRTVLVIGGGSAGLAAAFTLNRLGHRVTVFERSDRMGGLLMYGIPNMKLDKKIIQRRIDFMAAEGVEFVCNRAVTTKDDADALLDKYDAIVLCCGSTNPRNLAVEGREAAEIYYAVDYLGRNTKSLLDSDFSDGKATSAEGKHVVIVGGGDTGTDCAASSTRQGALSVTQIEIMDCPPAERAANNPWPQWPSVYKQDYGQQEVNFKYGADPRRWLTTVTKINSDSSGKVVSVDIVKVRWEKTEKGFIPVPQKGTEETIPCDLLLIAMGFTGPETPVMDAFSIERDARGLPSSKTLYHTTNEKVFTAGDQRRGQSLVVWAIAEGVECAHEVNKCLRLQK
ncbi:MAG: glutamate synthase subunit beta [Fibrobacter sp.]|nr:glutamate synthase subunit beta [Fibrobacter sp.]